MKKLLIILALLLPIFFSFSMTLPSGKYLLNFISGSQFMEHPFMGQDYYELIINSTNHKWIFKKTINSTVSLLEGKFLYENGKIKFILPNYILDYKISIENNNYLLINTVHKISLKPIESLPISKNVKDKAKVSFQPKAQLYPIFSEDNEEAKNKNFQSIPLKEIPSISQYILTPKVNLDKFTSLKSFYKYAIDQINYLFDPSHIDQEILNYFISTTDQASYINNLNLRELYKNNSEVTIKTAIAMYLVKDNLNKYFEQYSCKEEYNIFCNHLKTLIFTYYNSRKEKNNLIDKRAFYQYFWRLQFSKEHQIYDPIIDEDQIIDKIYSTLGPAHNLPPYLPPSEKDLDYIDLSFFHKKWITILPNKSSISCKWNLLKILNEDACRIEDQNWDAIVKFTINNNTSRKNLIEIAALIKFDPSNKNATLLWFYKDASIGKEVIKIDKNYFMFMPDKNVSNKVHGFFSALFSYDKSIDHRPYWFEYRFYEQ